MKRVYMYLVLGLIFSACGANSSEDEKLKLEKEKLELEKKKLELEKQKLDIDGNSQDDAKISNDEMERKPRISKQPSVSSQENVIYNFYRDFDNAFDQSSMRAFIDNYYGSAIKPKYLKEELPSYNYYSYKQHSVEDIILLEETDVLRKYKVIFYFTYEGNNGTSGSIKCADIITIDNSDMIVARSQLGKVK